MYRSALYFFVLLFFTRILGKKQMNQITYFDYITGITLGSIASEVALNTQLKVTDGLVAIAVWAGLAYLIAFVSLKSYKARNVLDGQPSIIIKKGKLQQETIQKTHLNMDDVTMLLREKDVFNITDVEYAILEPHGKLSVLKKPGKEGVTKDDMQVPPSPRQFLPTDIIIDGKLIGQNMQELGLGKDWLEKELAKVGLNADHIKKIFYMAVLEDGTAYINLKTKGTG